MGQKPRRTSGGRAGTFRAKPPTLVVLLVLTPLVLWLLFLSLKLLIRKVFLLDIYKPTARSLKRYLCDKVDENAFVVVNAPFVTKEKGQASNLKLYSLQRIATRPDWERTFNANGCGAETVIGIDNFDYRLDDPQTNQKKRRLLERLLKILVLDSTGLLHFSPRALDGRHDNNLRVVQSALYVQRQLDRSRLKLEFH
jgi:hypothetical protein